MEDKKDWAITTNRIVAFFDIMGFKDMVFRKSHEDVVKLLDEIYEGREALEKGNNLEGNIGRFGETKSYTFSDSIIFFSKGDTVEDFSKIVLDCSVVLEVALHLQIPIKGAVSYGKITVN